jgi:hypothetical protein
MIKTKDMLGYCVAIPQSGYLAKDGYYITSDLTKYEITLDNTYTPDTIALNNSDLIELVIPDWAKYINCMGNNLTELIIPDSVQYLSCMNNNLTELIVPDNCAVYCDYNVKLINKTMYNRINRLKQILK